MEKLSLDRPTHNLLDRLTRNVSELTEELERLNDNLEDQETEIYCLTEVPDGPFEDFEQMLKEMEDE